MPTTTLTAGQVFEDGKTATRAVQDYALAINKHVVVSRGGGGHKRFRCSSDACGFFVQLYQFRSNGKRLKSWYISSLHLEHVNCTSVGKVTGRQLGQLQAFRDAVLSDPTISARALAELVQRSEGIVPPDNSAIYRERDRVLRESKAEEDKRIPSLFEQFKRAHPGSYTAWEADATGGFRRAIVVQASLVRSMPFNQPALGMDCIPLKNDQYEGYQMALVGRDGNCDNVLIAVALVNEEDAENCTWFVQCLQETGLALADYPVLCNRTGGFAAVANAFNISVRYCTVHIIRTLLSTFPTFTDAHKQLIWGLQGATFEGRYQGCLSLIGTRCGVEVETYLRAITPEQWALYPAVGARPLYGWSTTHFVDRVSGQTLLDELREKGPYGFVDGVVELMTTSTRERAARGSKWAAESRIITPGAQALYEAQHLRMGKYVVTKSSPTMGSVARVGQVPPFPYHVDLSLNRCTCAFMDQFGVPCRHMIAMLASARAMESVFSRFAACYQVATFASAVGAAAVPQPAEFPAPPAQLVPVKRSLPQGKRRQDQNSSEGEERPTRVQRCGQCKEIDHNRRGCSRRSRPQMQVNSGDDSSRLEMVFNDVGSNTAQPQVQCNSVDGV